MTISTRHLEGQVGLDLPSSGSQLSTLKHRFKYESLPCEAPLAFLAPTFHEFREFKSA